MRRFLPFYFTRVSQMVALIYEAQNNCPHKKVAGKGDFAPNE